MEAGAGAWVGFEAGLWVDVEKASLWRGWGRRLPLNTSLPNISVMVTWFLPELVEATR